MSIDMERMIGNQLYQSTAEHRALQFEALKKYMMINRLYAGDFENMESYRAEVFRRFKELLGSIGDNTIIKPPFYCDYGKNIKLGVHVFIDMGCTILDDGIVEIGSETMIATNVSIFSASHPIDADIRSKRYLISGGDVRIGEKCWIGGCTIINPGVTIGNNVVIGAGSVVTHDIPDNVVAVGNPCNVLRPIIDGDKTLWSRKVAEYEDERRRPNQGNGV